jgi:hypothetical protein
MILRKDRGKHADVCVHRSTECDGCGTPIKYSDLTVSRIAFSFQVSCLSLFFFGKSGSLFGMFLENRNLLLLRGRIPAIHAARSCCYVFGSRRSLPTC